MREAQNSNFSETMWLTTKVTRRETREEILKEGLNAREEKASKAAESYRNDLNRKAELRDGIQKRSAEVKQAHLENLNRKAEEYRERLRGYLRPELREG